MSVNNILWQGAGQGEWKGQGKHWKAAPGEPQGGCTSSFLGLLPQCLLTDHLHPLLLQLSGHLLQPLPALPVLRLVLPHTALPAVVHPDL